MAPVNGLTLAAGSLQHAALQPRASAEPERGLARHPTRYGAQIRRRVCPLSSTAAPHRNLRSRLPQDLLLLRQLPTL